ncbi:MAG: IPT/TIG domain-containing protein [Chloroflexi bacterium]|nr:IPT/TIG domain-containing protein [Chloroflexota bacterium]
MFLARKYSTTLGLILALLMASIPSLALAADLISITPDTITNNVDNTITINGDGFDNTAVVLLNGSAMTDTVFLNDKTLRIVVPAGFASGTYTVTITMSSPNVVNGTATLVVNAPVPTATPTATEPPPPFTRPQVVVEWSEANVEQISTGNKFKFTVSFANAGNMTAFNAQAVFASADLVPLNTGGVVAVGNIPIGGSAVVNQRFISADSLYGKTFVLIDVTLTYYDDKGTSYSDKFTLTVPVAGGGGGTGVYATATPSGVRSGQLIIPSYGTTINPLQPGSQFTLTMTVQNAGNDKAQRVTMIVGGGTSGGSGGTPQAGGVSGGSGEFTNFAPVGTSNIKSLGDISSGGMLQVSQDLIVNVSTLPGAYPMKVTFSYLNNSGEVVNDEQVITLLVYSLPNIEISFYRPLDLFFSGQPGALPIQIVNLGKRTAVLGNMTVTSENGMIESGTSLVGSLDPGGYYTMDSMLSAETPGLVKLNIVIEYTDDFNQPRTIEKSLEVTVEEEFIETTPDPSMDGGGGEEFFPVPTGETFLQKTWRFILGLLGLDSAPPASSPEMPIPPIEEVPIPSQGQGGKGG